MRHCEKASLAAIYEGKMSYLYMEEWKKNKGMEKNGCFKLERYAKAQACHQRRRSERALIEAPCSKLQGIFDRKECGLFFDSLAYPAAIGGECARFRGSAKPHGPVARVKGDCC